MSLLHNLQGSTGLFAYQKKRIHRINIFVVSIEKVEQSCPACEEYAKKCSTHPPRIAVMACEGACSKGEVARMAANMVAHRLEGKNSARKQHLQKQ